MMKFWSVCIREQVWNCFCVVGSALCRPDVCGGDIVLWLYLMSIPDLIL